VTASPNLDLVRSIVAAWGRGDYSSAEWAHPDIELIRADGPEPGTWTGLSGLAEGTRYRLNAWEEFRVAADEIRDLDGERVLVLGHLSGRGKTSGLGLGQVSATATSVFHMSGGKVTRIVVYMNRDRALADLGLASEDSADS
jgi:ketosteroid isomerase-like protein